MSPQTANWAPDLDLVHTKTVAFTETIHVVPCLFAEHRNQAVSSGKSDVTAVDLVRGSSIYVEAAFVDSVSSESKMALQNKHRFLSGTPIAPTRQLRGLLVAAVAAASVRSRRSPSYRAEDMSSSTVDFEVPWVEKYRPTKLDDVRVEILLCSAK